MKTLHSFLATGYFLLICLTFSPGISFSQALPSSSSSPINITSHSDKQDVTIGEHVVFKIKVHHSEDITVKPPDPASETFLGFELMDFGHEGPNTIDGQLEDIFWFKLVGDRVGRYSIQNIKIPFTSKASSGESVPGEAKAPPHILQVRSVLYEDGQPEDIRDIKPIVGAGIDWRKYLMQVLVGLLFLSLVWGIIKWWHRMKKAAPKKQEEKIVSPQELALREIENLIERGWVEEGHFREFAFELSEIFRRYLGARFNIPALDWTTQEILLYFSYPGKMDNSLLEQVAHILNETDQIKFAKAEPELSLLREIVKSVRRFIEVTSKPEPKTEPQPAPAKV